MYVFWERNYYCLFFQTGYFCLNVTRVYDLGNIPGIDEPLRAGIDDISCNTSKVVKQTFCKIQKYFIML